MQRAYRLFRVDKDGLPRTIMHGWYGSRSLPLDQWLPAEVKDVSNPGDKLGNTYKSGWHVALAVDVVANYTNRFSEPPIICPVWVSDLEAKPRSVADMYLARWMLIDASDWMKIKS